MNNFGGGYGRGGYSGYRGRGGRGRGGKFFRKRDNQKEDIPVSPFICIIVAYLQLLKILKNISSRNQNLKFYRVQAKTINSNNLSFCLAFRLIIVIKHTDRIVHNNIRISL